MTQPFEVMRAGYDALGVRYREWSHRSPVRLRWLDRLLAELPTGSRVLELGCGAGEPATRLLADRHRVVAVDGSSEQLRLARSAAPAALLVQADMTRLAVAPGSVDAVASFYALGHLPAQQHAPLLHAIGRWLRPGGLLLTSAPLTAGESEEDWLGVRMFFGGIGERATRVAVDQAGLDVLEWEVVAEDEGDGRIVRFLWVLAQKPGPGQGG